jgi:HAD superfamily hydrolase (TIGR01662 family)
MSTEIQAIFFDLGETLRILHHDEAYELAAMRRITELVGTDADPVEFIKLMDERYEIYRVWAFENMHESTEAELWTRWMTPDSPREHIIKNSIDLSFQYRQAKGFRVLVDHGREVIQELHRRGYTLGIISNLITSREVPDWLKEDGLTQYFSTVVLSAVCGLRKPDPEIYRIACREIDISPEKCVYIGDNVNRDVTGAKAAGIGMNIIFTTPAKLTKIKTSITDANRPEGIICDFRELLKIFPEYPKSDLSNVEKI